MIIRRKYGLFAILLLVTFIPLLHAQNNWEGTAVVGRYGEFPPGGLYVASNTFPLNSMVSVTNMQSGRTARLIVAKTVDDPGVFMLLSEAAAQELGVTSADTIGVRVEPVQLPGLTSVDPNKDLPFHPDPDVNPAASLGDPNASIIQPGQGEEAPSVADTVPEASMSAESTPPETADNSAAPATTAPTTAPPATATPTTPVAEERPEASTPMPNTSVGVVADLTPEAEEDPEEELDTGEPADPQPPEPEEPAPDTPVAEVDETDFIGDGAVIGAAPSIAAQIVEESGEPEVSMPRVNPVPQPPLSVALVLPDDVAEEPRVAVDEETNIPAAPTPTPVPDPVPGGDPLAERIAEVESELAREQIASAPLDISPIGAIAQPTTDALDEEGALPEVDLTAAFVAESPTPVPEQPNPVRVVVELPPVEDRTTPQATIAAPIPPEVGPNEIALPLVPVESYLEEGDDLRLAEADDAEDTDSVDSLPEPEAPAEIATDPDVADDEAVEPLRPTKIPDDAIVTLEPAEYRTPEPPEPEVDELEPADAAEEEVAVALSEPREEAEGVVTPDVESEDAAEEPATDVAEVEAETDVAVTREPEVPVSAVEEATSMEAESDALAVDRGWAAENLPLIPRLTSGSAYVQVAAFSNPRSAKQTVEAIGDRFPVAVVSQSGADREVYRIFVGPLREDEKGSALYALRSRGFRDAFVRDAP